MVPGAQEVADRQGLHDLLAAEPVLGFSRAAARRVARLRCGTVLSSPPVGSPGQPDNTTPEIESAPAAVGGADGGSKAARRRWRGKHRSRTGRRLFAFDRELDCRFVAGADEAGRGSLAGPLVAAAVLFDLDRLTLTDRRALTRFERLQAAQQPRPARSSTRW